MVARDLLGKILVHRRAGTRLSGRIIETEAYLGLSDPASYAYSGKSTANAVLFGPPGLAHVYLIYGMQAIVAQQIQAFKQFPPRQKPAAFNLDAVLAQMQDASGSGYH